MGRYTAADSPEADEAVARAVAGVGADVAALRIARLGGVVLGGGYGRGEGGVARRPGEKDGLSNDLDFHVVTEEGAGEADIEAIARALEPVSRKWSGILGVDADFCRPKTPWRIRHDSRRLMIQELVRGYADVAGAPGSVLFRDVELRPPEDLPWTEAVRLLMNRGMGLLMSLEPRGDAFTARNLNKCVLGACDAALIARRGYKWKAAERAAAIGDGLYSAALEWKALPRAEPVCGWETARERWLAAADEVEETGRARGEARRSLRRAARWIARRRTAGELSTLGLEPELRVLRKVEKRVKERLPPDAELAEDWRLFN